MQIIIYVSKPTTPRCDRAMVLDQIRAVSMERNSRLEITGLLIACSRFYAQLLEGPSAAVQDVMTSILADTHHHELRIIDRAESKLRRFPMWSMTRFDGETFDNVSVTPILAAAHAQQDPLAASKLGRLMTLMARSPRIRHQSYAGRSR